MYNSDNYKIQNNIIKEVATEMGLDSDVVYRVVKSQWDLVKQTIRETDPEKRFFTIQLRYLGTFGVKNNLFKITKHYQHYYVPKEKIVRHIDPRRQKSN